MAVMGRASWDEWISEYSLAHQHPVNKLTHSIGIPMIAASVALTPAAIVAPGLWPVVGSLFVVGWVLQFIGHYFEGKPPEFLKDPRFLFVGLRWWFAKMSGRV